MPAVKCFFVLLFLKKEIFEDGSYLGRLAVGVYHLTQPSITPDRTHVTHPKIFKICI